MSEIRDAFGKPLAREDVVACVGKGWAGIINRLIDDLFALGWDGEVHQVKEKFGGLRFYLGGGTTAIFSRIYKAEAESQKTCEECGEPGTLRGDGWVYTACEAHTERKK